MGLEQLNSSARKGLARLMAGLDPFSSNRTPSFRALRCQLGDAGMAGRALHWGLYGNIRTSAPLDSIRDRGVIYTLRKGPIIIRIRVGFWGPLYYEYSNETPRIVLVIVRPLE